MSDEQYSLVPFGFQGHEIRAIIENDGSTWFVAKDVVETLDIAWRGSDTLVNIRDEWKGVRKFRTLGGVQELIIINEPAVYKLAFRSTKPEAERFTDWIVSDVLPSIRKTGMYNSLIAAMLLPEPTEWERRFGPEYYQPLCKLFGWSYTTHRPLPDVIGMITRMWIYEVVVPPEVLEELDYRHNKGKLHQWISDHCLKAVLNQAKAVATVAKSSLDYKDFSARCASAFVRPNQQLSLLFPR